MAILGKCFKLLFGSDPPTGRPPDPGGGGGGCIGEGCDCVGPNPPCECDNSCGDPPTYRCDNQTGGCVEDNTSVLSEEDCKLVCGQDPITCQCFVESIEPPIIITEGNSTVGWTQTKTVTII